MGGVACEYESWTSSPRSIHDDLEIERVEGEEERLRMRSHSLGKKQKNQVLLQGYVEAGEEDEDDVEEF